MRGDSSDGLSTTVFPNASAGAAFQSGIASGKVPWRDERDRAERIAQRELQRVGRLRGNHVADLAHRLAGVVPADHRRAGDLAARFADRLADFARHRPGQFVGAGRNRVAPAVQCFSARRTSRCPPRRPRGDGGVNSEVDVVRRAYRRDSNSVGRIGRVATLAHDCAQRGPERPGNEQRQYVGHARQRRVRVRLTVPG